ncbi:MAG: hypothetical protein K2K57_01200 [Oscillospiraceae bacterium]|nr:hypothetical protein [Oscillospiraceae bacterium]
MNRKSIIGILCAAGLCGLMLTACGKKDDTADNNNSNNSSQTATDNSAANNNNGAGNSGNGANNANGANGVEVHTDGANTVHGDNPGRSRDIDGDGFVEDVVDDVIDGAEDIIDDAARGVGDVLDDLSPDEHDRTTATTANR